MNPDPSNSASAVDAQHPWLGLTSFTEETRTYFHGREEEGAELARRVQRKLLTVLFGQSGLGKTSILQAGLVPRLRPDGFCPVYVRLDYHPDSPPPAEQIKRAVFEATLAAGTWTQTGSSVSGESLWEFLHHRDDVLKDAGGRTLIPILIFDQFEEIFTLGQTDDAGRKRAREFLADLADLVENRPPAALEARIDRDEVDAAKFDFARADYRILISLREDYLANLEALKGDMPSVTQNRMRLARMTGVQAIAAVRGPAPNLVTEAVAAAIVRFVSGGAELAHAEVEPSLLSLICRELNNTRLARGQAEISSDLLAGSRDTILSEFYERAVGDQPPGVRQFVEEELLTDSGFRENVALERAQKSLAAAGADPSALDTLVNRRLLRVEERLDIRRIELMHDVLCSVVKASRDMRHEREEKLAIERQLAATRAQEAAAQRALVRARLVAVVASALMLAAVASAVFGYINLRRARVADAKAQASRQLAEQARSESEKLIAFLLDDFYEELQPTGRVEIVGQLADRAVAYYKDLPPELMTPQTRLYECMALIRKADALGESGQVAEAVRVSEEAQKMVEQLEAQYGKSDEFTTTLALAIRARGFVTRSKTDLEQVAALLQPLVASGRASRPAKLALADALMILPHLQSGEQALATAEKARKVLADLGALQLTDLAAASAYGDATDTQARVALRLGRLDDSERLAKIVGDISAKVLERRPGDLRAMVDRFYSANVLGIVAEERHQLEAARSFIEQETEAARSYALFNPADSLAWTNWNSSNLDLGDLLLREGRVAGALRQYRLAAERSGDPHNKTGVDFTQIGAWSAIEHLEAQLGNLPATRAAHAEIVRTVDALAKKRMFNPELVQIARLSLQSDESTILAAEDDYAAVHALAVKVTDEIGQLKDAGGMSRIFLDNVTWQNRVWLIESALRLDRVEEAVTAARAAVDHPITVGGNRDQTDRDAELNRAQVRLGQALRMAGQTAEARDVLDKAVIYYRAQQAGGAVEMDFRHDFARALCQLALAQPGDGAGRRRTALLKEAADLLESMTAEARQLRSNQELAGWIAAARAQPQA